MACFSRVSSDVGNKLWKPFTRLQQPSKLMHKFSQSGNTHVFTDTLRTPQWSTGRPILIDI